MRIIGLWGQECARKVASDHQTKGRLPLWAIDRLRPAAENANDICKGEILKPARTAGGAFPQRAISFPSIPGGKLDSLILGENWRPTMRDYFHRRTVLKALFTSVAGTIVLSKSGALAQGDALPSWRDGKARQSILDFVAAVTRDGSPGFVPVPHAWRPSIMTARCGANSRCTFSLPSRLIR